MSTVFKIRFTLLEAESSVNSMETEIDCLKEQILLMREAIQEKQSYINRIRPRLEKVMTLRKDRHE